MGIPLAFPGPTNDSLPTKPNTATHVRALQERKVLESTFPRVFRQSVGCTRSEKDYESADID